MALALREATLDVQLAAFDADEIDAGFVLHAPGAAPPGLAARVAVTESMLLALPESHPGGRPGCAVVGRHGRRAARHLPA